MRLAKELVARFHDGAAADAAEAAFDAVSSRKERPQEVQRFEVLVAEGEVAALAKALIDSACVKSASDAKREIAQGAVTVNGERVTDVELRLGEGTYELKVGKRRFLNLVVRRRP